MTCAIARPRVDERPVDRRAREPVCPVEVIYHEDDLPVGFEPYPADNEAFFARPLPGGAAGIDPLGTDAPSAARPSPQGPRKEEG